MIREILSQGGYDVVGEAETGVDAVRRFGELRPDIVTMEVILPDLGGIEAVRQIMRLDPEARIVMCSAMAQQDLVAEAFEAGARDFVVKPFQPSRLLEAVQLVMS
jgi:two-component system chemotaxis response regulator CheY